MTTFMPRGYGALPFFQFTSPALTTNRHYNDRSTRQDTYFSSNYPSQPYYQPHNVRDRLANAGNQILSYFSALDDRYRYEQYMRRLEKVEKEYAKLQMYPPTTMQFQNDPGVVYQYEKETKFVPMPVFVNPATGSYRFPSNFGFGTTHTNLNYPLSGGMDLPPKVRVIFMPTGQSSFQQPYTGPLEMPPFFYNRISQPLCSFPLPPPLPQLGSLPITPAVQEMVVQRYSNPIAVLPYMPSWPMAQTTMPYYPQMSAYQQQQPLAPISAFQPQPAVQQSYIPPLMPSLPSISAAPSSLPSIPAAPSSLMPSCTSVQPFSSQQPASMPVMSSNISAFSQPVLQSSYPQSSDYSYPSTCRACPPAPPPLTIPVTGHCWVQHCAACHQVPMPVNNPNARPSGGRSTPLLRQPTVPQYVPDQTVQQKEYLQTAAPVMIRPWLRKTPPLPPGAVLISDTYINPSDYFGRPDYSRRKNKQHYRSSRPDKKRSVTVTSTTVSTISPTVVKGGRNVSPKKEKEHVQSKPPVQEIAEKSPIKKPVTPSSDASSDLTIKYKKQTLSSVLKKENSIPPQLASEARNVNVNYTYQPQELTSVYLLNRYLKSSSEASTVSSNVEASIDSPALSVKEDSHSPTPTNDLSSIKEETNSEKEDEKTIRPPSVLKQKKERIIIIREFLTSSPSTMSTISSNSAFSIIKK